MPKKEDAYFNLMSSLAESVMDMENDELEEAIREDGDNIDQIKLVLSNAVKKGRKIELKNAREEYEAEVARRASRTYDLPTTPAEKRRRISDLIATLAAGQKQLTLQFRDYEALPDEDLDSVLIQLMELESGDE